LAKSGLVVVGLGDRAAVALQAARRQQPGIATVAVPAAQERRDRVVPSWRR
jgi:hypothetical protein